MKSASLITATILALTFGLAVTACEPGPNSNQAQQERDNATGAGGGNTGGGR